MLQDLIHSIRALSKRPGFSLLAILTIALGVGVNTAMFTIVNGVLWKPFPYPQQERLVRFNEDSPSGKLNNSLPNSQDWKARSNVLEDVALYRGFPQATLLLGDRSQPLRTGYTHATLFSILRVQPSIGRLFNASDDNSGAEPVAVITDAAWTKYFGKDPAILGKPVKVAMANAKSITVVGVLPEGFDYDAIDMWAPLGRFPAAPDTMRDNHWFLGVGRLNPGVSMERARSELAAVSAALEREHPATNKGVRVEVVSFADYYAGKIKTPLVILFWAVGFVMLIACGNVVHLVLTRTLARGRELAVRMAMGARGWRLTWLLLAEGLVLAIAGGGLGLLAAAWAVPAALKAQPGLLPVFRVVKLDAQAVVYALGATLVTALLLALIPVWRLTKMSVRDALQAGGRSASDRRHTGAWLMIAGEIAMASVLLVGAGMMIQALRNLARVDIGYDPSGLVSVAFDPPAGKQYTDDAAKAVLDRVKEAARSVPGYQAMALSANFAVGGNGMLGPVVIPGRTNASTPPLVPAMIVSPEFFETMRIPFKAGHTFAAVQGKIPEAIVNEEFVRRFLPDENPIGRQISVWEPEVIAGVVGNSRLQGGLPEVKAEVYLPGINFAYGTTVLVRVQGSAASAGTVLRDRIKAVEPGIRTGAPRTLVSREEARTVIERFTRSLLLVFAVLAVVLACLGMYGVASYSVEQRIREIGIRMALGASRSSVTRLVTSRTIGATALGAVVGIAGAGALSRVVKSQLFEVSAWDPVAVFGTVLALGVVAVVATLAPVLRASRVDPAISLRQD